MNHSPPNVSFLPARRRLSYQHRAGAFTLVEVALALGIIAFALLPIVGLVPIGMQVSNSATDQTMTAQIGQRLIGLMRQSDPSNYAALEASCYYFDNEGQLLSSAIPNVPGAG